MHVNHYLYIANQSVQNIKGQKIESFQSHLFNLYICDIGDKNFGLMCGGSTPCESDLHILQCEEVSDNQLKAHHSQWCDPVNNTVFLYLSI